MDRDVGNPHKDCTITRRWEKDGYWYEDHDGSTSFHRITNRPPPSPEAQEAIERGRQLGWRSSMWAARH